jgi:hypothetical protein
MKPAIKNSLLVLPLFIAVPLTLAWGTTRYSYNSFYLLSRTLTSKQWCYFEDHPYWNSWWDAVLATFHWRDYALPRKSCPGT